MLRKTALAFGIAAIGTQAHSQQEAQQATATTLGEITVSATRTERDATNVPSTVSVYGTKKIEARDPRDLKELLDSEVDLALRSSAPRFSVATGAGRSGNESLNIRGLEGNQIAILVDGIRAPQAFSFGPIATSRTDYLDVDSLATAEVLRGPASAQFGSDGLGGALVLRTLDPDDLLLGQGKARRSTAGFLRVGAASVDDSAKVTAAVAGEAGAWQGLLLATERRGHETDNMGSNTSPDARRTAPNPADTRSHSLLAKAGYKIDANQRLMATLDARRRDVNTEVLSARAAPRRAAARPPPPSSTSMPATASTRSASRSNTATRTSTANGCSSCARRSTCSAAAPASSLPRTATPPPTAPASATTARTSPASPRRARRSSATSA